LLKKSCLVFALFSIAILFLPCDSFAAKLTVDADGGSTYTTITAALNASNSGDTIYIQGNDIDTYDESWPSNRSANLTIMGASSNPDSFPIVRFSGGDWANYWQNNSGTTKYERIIINNWATINLINTQRNCVINRCIIKNFNSTVFSMSGDHNNYLTITNSVFWSNNSSIFSQPPSHNVNGPYANVLNCTFYNNTSNINAESNVSVQDVINNKIVIIKNSIFNNCPNIVSDTDIKTAYTYNLLPDGQSGFGTGSIYTNNPGFTNASPQKASDFALLSSSAAIGKADSTGAPSVDINGTSRSFPYDIGAYEYGSGGSGSSLYWDISTSVGFQAGNGTWGINDYWTSNGTTLTSWPDTGYSATFTGEDGNWTVTINNTQNVDSIAFLKNGYTLSGGSSLNFVNKSGVFVDSGKSATISTVISGSPGISKYGNGTLILSGANTYSGNTVVNKGTLAVQNNNALGNTTGTTILNGANPPAVLQLENVSISNETITMKSDSATKAISHIYVPASRTASYNGTINFSGNYYNKIISDGTINVQGNISGSGGYLVFLFLGGSGINNSMQSTISFTNIHILKDGGGTWTIYSTGNTWSATCVNNGTLKNGASNCLPTSTILIIGTTDANNATYDMNGFNQTVGGIADGGTTGGTKQITNSSGTEVTLTVNNSVAYTYSYLIGGAIKLTKSGSAKFTLAGANSYTGATTISAGNLCVNGSISSASAVSVASGATLSGTGTVSGNISVANEGKIEPGDENTATLSTGNLILNNSSILNFQLGSSSDKIAVSGNLTLDGILNVTGVSGFSAGTYTIMTCSGSITNNSLSIGSVPTGYDCSIEISGGNVNFIVSGTVYPENVVTVDADGDADYNSLGAVLAAIQLGTIDPDTIMFIGSNQHTYICSTDVNRNIGYIVFKGAETDPDKFPIISHTKFDLMNFFSQTNAHFQRVILTGTLGYSLGEANRTFSFKQCIIRDFSGSYAFYIGGYSGGTVIIENCLFEGNTCTDIFNLNYWGGTPTFSITNCTFDNNKSIWDEDEDQNTNFSIKNSIFSGNITTFRGNNLRSKTTYSLTSESTSGYGTGCVTGDPKYVSSSRNNPSDWKLSEGSAADNIGTSSGAPTIDLGGVARSGSIDAGCWFFEPVKNYYWDVNTTSGYQAGNGTWGTDNYWTSNGTTLVSWPGAGKSATFAGSDGEWTINVNGTQNVDSIAFLNDGYTITGGTSLNFSTKSGVLVNDGKTGNINSVITGSPGLSKYGNGTLVLGGSNTFSGPVTINAGKISTIYLNNGGSSSNIGSSSNSASNLVFNGGTLKYSGVFQFCDRLFTLGTNGGTIDGSGIGQLVFYNTGTMGFIGSGARTLTLTGSCIGNFLAMVISDNGGATSITKSGSGLWILNGNNTATGTVNITDGTLQIGSGETSGSINGPVINNGTLIFNRSNSFTFNQIISGNGDLVKEGNGTLTLSGLNTYGGSTSINTGTLQLGAANVIPDGSTKGDVFVYGVFDLNSYSETINGLSGNGIVDNSTAGSPVLTIGANNANSTFSGSIKNSAGTLGLIKTGSGEIIFTGNNTYSGPTTVSGGDLKINGSTSSSSAFTVQSGAKISGNGIIGGQVTINDGGEISPGNNSVGKLTTGSLILNNSSILNFDLGTSSDQIIVNGNLKLDGILNITNAGGFDAGDYTIITFTGSLESNVLSIGTTPLNSYNYSIEESSTKVILHVMPKEELLPLTVVKSASVCSVYTEKWTLLFDNNNGGGIITLTDSIHGLDHGQGNQIGASQNLFFLDYNGISSKQNGSWSVKEIGSFRTIISQNGTLGAGILYNNDYTIYGSGKIFIKSTISNSGSDVSGKTLRLGCERNPVATMAVYTGKDDANQSPYVLLSSNASLQNDILLCIKDLWATSVAIPNSATGFYYNASSGYAGYECNNFSLGSGQRQSWEFMVDFIHQNWNDTTGIGIYADDYCKPDSLVYLTGTPAMEKDWEQHLYGHWKFDETATTIIASDASGNNRHGVISGGSWTSGRLDGAIQLNGSQNISVFNNEEFNGNNKFTIMAWIKPSTVISSSSAIIEKHNGALGWKFSGDELGRLSLTLNGTSLSGTTATIGTGVWHHVAVSWNTAGSVIFYVDGNVDRILSGSFPVTINSENVIIGSGFDGAIDDVRCYGDTITENTIKSIYRNGIRSSEGAYDTRANNENNLNVLIDGDNIPRRFPVFRIANYWATSKPAPGCVRLNGNILTEGDDYFADLVDKWNLLYIGLNKVIISNSVNLFIDDANSQSAVQRKTPIMVSGKQSNGSFDYFWVKNFTEDAFDSSSSKQWYINWKMSENDGKDGDPWFMAASVSDPFYKVDTAFLTNLIPGYDGYNDSWGSYCFKIDSYYPKTTNSVSEPFTYAVEESSGVRVVLRINERVVNYFGSSFKIVTRWTIYPTGQFFKWDSIYGFTNTPSKIFHSISMNDSTYSSLYLNKSKKRGGVIYSSRFQDFVSAWLSMKNNTGYQSQPFTSDTILTYRDNSRVSLDFADTTAPSKWNSPSIQTVVYMDMQHSEMNSAFIDSAANSVQYPLTPVMISGSLLSGSNATEGDLNGDGFNERDGAYVIKSSNNEVHLRLPARSDTCRFQPVFRITDYTATSKPQYVIIYRGTDTLALAEGHYYNAYLNRTNKELVIQIDSVFCDTVSIFISSDRTLAVNLSQFSARGGDRCDTLFWRTESEQENLGFYLLRRVCPVFLDSLLKAGDKKICADVSDTLLLLKNKKVTYNDTEWIRINEKIIPGAKSGVSFGPHDYKYIDYNVQNDILYEYKLISVDYSNKEKTFGPVQAIPRRFVPAKFALFRNFPNPLKTYTIIRFALPQDSRVSLNIYNLQGRLVKRLIKPEKVLSSGIYQVTWNGKGESGAVLASGPYIYRLVSGKFADSHIMLIAK